MKKILLISIVLLSAESLFSQVKIVTIGNSITQAQPPYNSYRRQLWKLLENEGYNVDFVGSMNTLFDNVPAPEQDFDQDHEGHWGWRADEIINGRAGYGKLSDWLQDYTPDIALIHIGTNDAVQEQSTSSTLSQIGTIIDILRQDNPGITLLIAQVTRTSWTPAISERIQSLAAAIPELKDSKAQQGSDIYIVDMNTDFIPSQYTYDNLHPNAAGENFMAQKWFEVLDPLLSGTVFIQPPGNPAVSQLNLNQAQLTWTDTDPQSDGIVIERSYQDDPFRIIDTVGIEQLEFIDELSEPGEYRYRLYSYMNSTNSAKTEVFTLHFINNPPLPPLLEMNGKTSGSVSLSLQPQGEMASGIFIQREEGPGFETIGSIKGTGGIFTDEGLASSTTYRYRAYSENFAGSSGFSEVLEVTTSEESNPGEPRHYYWSFDENTGDVNGSGRSFQAYAGAGLADFSLGPGRSLDLTGTEDYAVLPAFDIGDTFSLSFWAYSNDDSRNIKTLFGKGVSGGWEDGFKITYNSYLNDDKKIIIEMGDGTNEAYVESAAGLFTSGKWNHVVVTFDRNASNLNLFFNGEEITVSGDPLNTFTTQGDYYLGSMENKSYFFDGYIDELHVFEGEILTYNKIQDLYNEGVVFELPERCSGNDIKVYPNPFRSDLTIVNPGGRAETFLYSSGGHLRLALALESGERKRLNLGYLETGIYLLSVTRDGETVMQKRLLKI